MGGMQVERSRRLGRCVFSQKAYYTGRWGCTSALSLFSLFLKILTGEAVKTEAGSLSQFFTSLTEELDSLLWQWFLTRSTL